MTPKEAREAGYEVRREGCSKLWYFDCIGESVGYPWRGYRTRREALDVLEKKLAEMPELDQRNRSCEGDRS